MWQQIIIWEYSSMVENRLLIAEGDIGSIPVVPIREVANSQ